MVVFRMHAVARDAFDTQGAFLHPGRWHSAGTRVIYAAEHASLAVLETLIHAGGKKLPPRAITRIHIPDDLLIETGEWADMPHSQAFGDMWVKQSLSVVLRVPSIAVNKMESNLVINPAHPDFGRIHHDPQEEFPFNPRFFLAVQE
jgi:RES domain-containing protein